MLQSSILRPVIGLPLAGLIVFGLYSFMNAMISQDYERPEDIEPRELVRFTPPENDTEARPRPRDKPQPIPTADKPPPPPKMSAAKSIIDLPTPNITGAAPTELIQRLSPLAIDPVAIGERDAQPIRPPVATYPRRAADLGIEGTCEVHLDVDTRGRPYNVEAECSDSMFEREAERAVSRVEFVPKIVRGKPAERHNVVYPLEFRLNS